MENGGLIVAKARHVELAGGTGVVSSCMPTHTSAPAHAYTYTHALSLECSSTIMQECLLVYVCVCVCVCVCYMVDDSLLCF